MLPRARQGALDAGNAGPFHPRGGITYGTSYVLNTTKWHSPEAPCVGRSARKPLTGPEEHAARPGDHNAPRQRGLAERDAAGTAARDPDNAMHLGRWNHPELKGATAGNADELLDDGRAARPTHVDLRSSEPHGSWRQVHRLVHLPRDRRPVYLPGPAGRQVNPARCGHCGPDLMAGTGDRAAARISDAVADISERDARGSRRCRPGRLQQQGDHRSGQGCGHYPAGRSACDNRTDSASASPAGAAARAKSPANLRWSRVRLSAPAVRSCRV
jgi:hypothetical protein